MKNNIIYFIIIQCVIDFIFATSILAQTPKIKGGKTVVSGNNAVDWQGKLKGEKDTELIATFTPGQKKFVPNSVTALSINERQWQGNLKNSSTLASFKLTLPHQDFKTYNTTFSGYFSGDGKGTEYDRWNASEMLYYDPTEHTYFNISNDQREISDNESGVSFNKSNDTSQWNNYNINKIKTPLNFTPNKNHVFKDLRNALGNHVTALAPNAQHPSQGAYLDLSSSVPQFQKIAYKSAETNQDCKGTDSNGNTPDPPCKKMQRGYIGLKITYDCGAAIYLPTWKQLNEQNQGQNNYNISQKTNENWQTMYNLFETHEKTHSDNIKKVAQECKKIEKTAFIIEMCNYEVTPEEIDEVITPIRQQLFAIAESIKQQDETWCIGNSASISTQLNKITDYLLNR
ncbi:MAG: hypothetical protein LBE12_12725 [Planctomycetaceae bacterium]|jgi:hypothetical protein|nr:hypothetical protein [Planctomycetaceae bacterium]